MSESQETEPQEGEEEATGGGKKKIIIIAVAALLLLGGGGGGAAFFLGVFDSAPAEATAPADEGEEAEQAEATDAEGEEGSGKTETADAGEEGSEDGGAPPVYVYVDLPDVLVNLQSESRRARFLKLKVALEVGDEETGEVVKTMAPRILDSFQLYLRALTADEVKGSAGMQRLKAEMLARINNAIRPIRITDLLFKEMLVQ